MSNTKNSIFQGEEFSLIFNLVVPLNMSAFGN